MKNLKLGNVILAVALLLSAVLSANVSAQPVCGGTLFANTTLIGDLLGCPGRGLRIGADNVTLDCDNHTIEAAGGRVVEVNFGLDSVTVRNCVLIGTADTQALQVNGGTTNILITDNQITTSGISGHGIRTLGTSFSTILNNTITTSGLLSTGIRLQNSSDNLLENNTIATSAPNSRGFRLEMGSKNNHIIGNFVHTTGEATSVGVLLRPGSDGNTVSRNVLRTDDSPPVQIDSSSGNRFRENTLVSATDWLFIGRFPLQQGGLSVHPDGRIFVAEGNFGGGGAGLGTATAFMEIDPATGAAFNPIRLTQGGFDLGFGFDALEITPDGRFLAVRGGGFSDLYEIDPGMGEVTFLFFVNNFGGSINGLESNGVGSLLATTNSGNLVSIDLLTMSSALIGSDGSGWTDLAIDPMSGRTYAFSRHRTEASQSTHLFEIDTTTGGIVQEIGDTGLAFVSDMDFASDGTLYANHGSLLVVDPASAATESVGDFGEDPFEPPSENNSLSKTTLVAVGGSGSVHYPGTLAVPSGELVNVSTAVLDISFNRVFVDSASHPFLDQKAIITLLGLPGKKRRLLVDEDDDGEFEKCRGRCKLRLFAGGTLVFKVGGFTTYSSEERTKQKKDNDEDD